VTEVVGPEPAAERLNGLFDRVVGVHVRVGGLRMHAWRAFSLAAFAAATVVWLALGARRGLDALVLVVPPAVAFAVFSADRRRILRARAPQRMVFHRHLAASAAVTVALLALLGELEWRVIDTAAPAVLVGLAVGRGGCLRTGCCAGRPASVGPRYPWLDPPGRRFPVQVLDAAVCLALAATAIGLSEADVAGGVATAAGLGGYLVVRGLLDEWRDRGDRTGRLTEAQYLALAAGLTVAVAALLSR
jgi:phosphatidylglycerol:prolipoprotein diacylglycerol transferase